MQRHGYADTLLMPSAFHRSLLAARTQKSKGSTDSRKREGGQGARTNGERGRGQGEGKRETGGRERREQASPRGGRGRGEADGQGGNREGRSGRQGWEGS